MTVTRNIFRQSWVLIPLLVAILSFAQVLAAAKHAAKGAQARVIYSGSFRGHVEPCG
ncbi:MAG: hypothetical protein IPG71_00940 [bacterium]|nr:hypothetical protein [bacterium]